MSWRQCLEGNRKETSENNKLDLPVSRGQDSESQECDPKPIEKTDGNKTQLEDLEGVSSAVYNNMQATIRSHEFLMIDDEGWVSWELQTGKVGSSDMSDRIMKAVKRAAAWLTFNS